jgi:cytidylate kinase
MECILAFGGRSKSGKTTLAKRLAKEMDWRFASFGDYVRHEAGRRGLHSPSAEQLQDVGLSLVRNDILGFCRSVLEDSGFVPGEGLVVDGIRHLATLAALRVLTLQQCLKFVYLESSFEERVRRGLLSPEALEKLDSHAVESEMLEIKGVADLVLNTSSCGSNCFTVLRGWVLQQQR